MACTPASSWRTVPDPSGRVLAFSESSDQSSSNVFTTDQPSWHSTHTRSHARPWTGQDGRVPRSIADLDWPVTTERLTLRPAEQRDALPTYAFRTQDAVAHWLTNHPLDPDEWESGFGERSDHTLVVQKDGVVIGD